MRTFTDIPELGHSGTRAPGRHPAEPLRKGTRKVPVMSAPTADVVIRGAIRPWSCDGEESPGKAKSPDMTRNSAACRGDHICLVTVPTLAPAADLAAGAHPSSVAVDDFNRAGVADLAVTDYGFDTVLVLLGRGDGTFQAAVNYALGSHPWSVAVADSGGHPLTRPAAAWSGRNFREGAFVSLTLPSGRAYSDASNASTA